MMGHAVAIALALIVNILVPLALGGLLARRNFRRRTSAATEKNFWLFAGLALGLAGLAVPLLVSAAYQRFPELVSLATVATFPFSWPTSQLTLQIMHGFFSRAEWAEFGYEPIVTIYIVGLALVPLWWMLVLRAFSHRHRSFERSPEKSGAPSPISTPGSGAMA